METGTEIRSVKLAKVGRDRERKKGGLGWFSGAGGGGSAVLGVKIGVSLIAAALGVGAYGVGKSMAPNYETMKAEKPKIFATDKTRKYEGNLSALPSESKFLPNSLNMVSGSLDGKTPEQRAADAAAAEAAAKAEAEQQAKADTAAPPEAAGVPAGMDPAAIAAQAQAGADAGDAKKNTGPFGSRFGALSSSLGGGGGARSSLAGGSGLSGGVGQSFSGSLGGARSFSGGSNAGRSAASSYRAAGSRGRGLAARQLYKASQYSNAARTGATEARATNADAAFNNNAGAGQAVTGGGAGTGPIGAGIAPDAATNPSGGGGGSQPSSSNPNDGETPMDDCSQLGDGYVNSWAGGCVKIPKGKNITPWQGMVDMVKILLLVANALLLIGTVLTIIAKTTTYGEALWPIIGYLGTGAAILGGIATLMGIAIIGMGQTWQGIMYTILGGATTVGGILMRSMAGEKSQTKVKAGQAAADKTADKMIEAMRESGMSDEQIGQDLGLDVCGNAQ